MEARLADSLSASEVSRLCQDHEEHINDLQARAGRALDLEVELAKAKDAELTAGVRAMAGRGEGGSRGEVDNHPSSSAC
jgi:hypothetical protein